MSHCIDSDIVSFVQENEKVITSIYVTVSCIREINPTPDFNLINLRYVTISVTPEFRFEQYNYLVEFLNNLVQESRHLEQFILAIQSTILLPADLAFPSKLTELSLSSKKKCLPNLIDEHLPKLVKLSITSLIPDN